MLKELEKRIKEVGKETFYELLNECDGSYIGEKI